MLGGRLCGVWAVEPPPPWVWDCGVRLPTGCCGCCTPPLPPGVTGDRNPGDGFGVIRAGDWLGAEPIPDGDGEGAAVG